MIIAMLLGDWLMGAWLGERYRDTAGPIFKILSFGFLFYSLMLLPFTALQAAGRSKITAMVYLLELPIYAGLLVVMINLDGLRGAGFVWVGKTFFEFLVFLTLSKKYVIS